jgi:diguanylate cyclase (GGDEF)-like protein/PAS domain S-box-containing protein
MNFNDEYYRLIFENSYDAILLTQPDGSVHLVNPAGCEMLQRTAEEICYLGRPGLVDPEDKRLENALRERTAKGKARSELTLISGDVSKIPVEVTSSIFNDNEGRSWTVMVIRDMTFYKQLEDSYRINQQQAIQLATRDYLTGINNRRGFMERLQQEIDRCKRKGSELGLISIDLDYFKQINDIYGHIGGDCVLKKFADCLNQNMRLYDIPARFGGDEFIVCLPSTSLYDATGVAERLRMMTETLMITYNSQTIKLTASFGVTTYKWNLPEDIDSFVSRADDAMYQAKKTKNSVCVIE